MASEAPETRDVRFVSWLDQERGDTPARVSKDVYLQSLPTMRPLPSCAVKVMQEVHGEKRGTWMFESQTGEQSSPEKALCRPEYSGWSDRLADDESAQVFTPCMPCMPCMPCNPLITLTSIAHLLCSENRARRAIPYGASSTCMWNRLLDSSAIPSRRKQRQKYTMRGPHPVYRLGSLSAYRLIGVSNLFFPVLTLSKRLACRRGRWMGGSGCGEGDGRMGEYVFSVCAETVPGEVVVRIGSDHGWKAEDAQVLKTSAQTYPLWSSDPVKYPVAQIGQRVTYKYAVRSTQENGCVHLRWEAEGGTKNRSVPLEAEKLRVFDGWFNRISDVPFGFHDPPKPMPPIEKPIKPHGKYVLVLGSSVAVGCNAWKLEGWAYLLGKALRESFGHSLVNTSESGSNIARAIQRFPDVVAVVPETPAFVVISLSLGNEGIFHCKPHERNAVYARFISGMDKLVSMVEKIGAIPVVGGVYPNGDCIVDAHMYFIREARAHFKRKYRYTIEWFDDLSDDCGRWKEEYASDNAHPNTTGHQVMRECIDLAQFAPPMKGAADAAASETYSDQDHSKVSIADTRRAPSIHADLPSTERVLVAVLGDTFQISCEFDQNSVTSVYLTNTRQDSVGINKDWLELQNALRASGKLEPGLYVRKYTKPSDRTLGLSPIVSLFVGPNGTIETTMDIGPGERLEFQHSRNALFCPSSTDLLFYDGVAVVIFHDSPEDIWISNETDTEYNLHPMWNEVRCAMRSIPGGVYDAKSSDGAVPDFSTLLIGNDGLASRVKIPPRTARVFKRTMALAELERFALVPLGARCSMRMLLHELQYDGPCYPFDLTRVSSLADAADIVWRGFSDMWNPEHLHYSHDDGRVFHTRWNSLSFAHEVEENDDPVNEIGPIFKRMGARYARRAERFDFVLRNANQVILLRTGESNRQEVLDFMGKVRAKYNRDNAIRLFLFSRQDSGEFGQIPGVRHFQHEMDPDRMNDDAGYRTHCAHLLKHMLNETGVTSRNLFWCPNNPNAKPVSASNAGRSDTGLMRSVDSAETLALKSLSSELQLDRLFATHAHASPPPHIATADTVSIESLSLPDEPPKASLPQHAPLAHALEQD
ncbi:hypothetical protein FVE85_4835 [Porphyridium purpureum]|uniref:SGNH hydrolase-type esterase domain-containing protein n=1 Tax=Porphyridium purpureum TaxID=35688 RepID=A0A5J4YQU7_PORPP|nr:hypothetical protein FVE85_4835 [Porphyridium purpureum]|eukprot:POR4559..scf236_6